MARPAAGILVLLLAGCLTPADPEGLAPTAKQDVHDAGVESHPFSISNLGASVCTVTQFDGGNTWTHQLDIKDNDTRLALRADWTPVNPTVETLHFRLTAYAGSFALEWHETTPFEVAFEGAAFEGLPRPAYLTVAAWGCSPGDLVTVQAAPPFVVPQEVLVQVSWNGAPFQA